MYKIVYYISVCMSSFPTEYYNVSDGENWKFCLSNYFGTLTAEGEEQEGIFLLHDYRAAYFYNRVAQPINKTNEYIQPINLPLVADYKKNVIKRQIFFRAYSDFNFVATFNGSAHPAKVLLQIEGIHVNSRTNFTMILYASGMKHL